MDGIFWKVALLKILRSPLLTGVTGLQYKVCKATKNELLTKFLKSALKLTENFHEMISNWVPYQKSTNPQTAAFSFACFCSLWDYVHCRVPFFRSSANGFFTE